MSDITTRTVAAMRELHAEGGNWLTLAVIVRRRNLHRGVRDGSGSAATLLALLRLTEHGQAEMRVNTRAGLYDPVTNTFRGRKEFRLIEKEAP